MFVVNKSSAISIGASAVNADLSASRVVPVGTRIVDSHRGGFVKLINTHASQLLYWKKGTAATVTSANADGVVGAGKEAIIGVDLDEVLQLIASGASTTGFLEIGNIK